MVTIAMNWLKFNVILQSTGTILLSVSQSTVLCIWWFVYSQWAITWSSSVQSQIFVCVYFVCICMCICLYLYVYLCKKTNMKDTAAKCLLWLPLCLYPPSSRISWLSDYRLQWWWNKKVRIKRLCNTKRLVMRSWKEIADPRIHYLCCCSYYAGDCTAIGYLCNLCYLRLEPGWELFAAETPMCNECKHPPLDGTPFL